MNTAPTDGTWIIGVDEKGNEERIQRRRTMPGVEHFHWGKGEIEEGEHFTIMPTFHPVSWRPETTQ